jgi:hypothetical protein
MGDLAMEYSHSEVKAGVMIIGALILGFVILIMIGNWEAWFGEYYTFVADFTNVSGLARDAEIQYHGVKAGWVRSVDIVTKDNRRVVRVTGWISKTLGGATAQDLQSRDYAVIEKLITGKVVINVVYQPEEEGGTWLERETDTWHVESKDVPSFTDIQEEAAHVIHTLREFLDENREPVAKTTKELAAASETLARMIEENEGNVNQAIKALGEAAGQVRDALQENKGRLKTTFDKAIAALDSANSVLTDNRLALNAAIEDVAAAAANIRAATQDLRNNPWKIYYRPRPSDVAYQNLYDTMQATYSTARDLRRAAEALRQAAEADPKLAPSAKAAEAELRKLLEQLEAQQRKAWDEWTSKAGEAR